MTLTVNSVGDNPQQPMLYAETYIPDQLIAGNLKLVSAAITLAAGTLPRGSVLGLQSGTPTVTANLVTGNGTCGAVSAGGSIQPGEYTLRATGAATFTVAAPDGLAMPDATVGTAYISADLNFTLTAGGTAFAAGDEFTIDVLPGGYVLCKRTAQDGSQIPAAILTDFADASAGAVTAGAYVMGEFNVNALNVDASWGANAAAWGPMLTAMFRNTGIFLKSAVTATDPT